MNCWKLRFYVLLFAFASPSPNMLLFETKGRKGMCHWAFFFCLSIKKQDAYAILGMLTCVYLGLPCSLLYLLLTNSWYLFCHLASLLSTRHGVLS